MGRGAWIANASHLVLSGLSFIQRPRPFRPFHDFRPHRGPSSWAFAASFAKLFENPRMRLRVEGRDLDETGMQGSYASRILEA